MAAISAAEQGSRLYSFGMPQEYDFEGPDDPSRYTYSLRGLHMAAEYPENSILLVPKFPGDHDYLSDQSEIFDELGLKMPRYIIVKGGSYRLDRDILASVDEIRAQLSDDSSGEITLYSYARTVEQDEWVRAMREAGVNIRQALPPREHFRDIRHPQHRCGWGRWVRSPEDPSFPERHDLDYPVSWVGTGRDEVVDAYLRVAEQSRKPLAFIKPGYSAGGYGIKKVTSQEDVEAAYDELKGSGFLDAYRDSDGNPVETAIEVQEGVDIRDHFSVQYTDGKIITPGGLSRQYVDLPGHWQGNSFRMATDPDARHLGGRAVAALRSELGDKFYGPGGIDLATLRSGQVIIEHNGGRITGVHPVISAVRNLGLWEQPVMFHRYSGMRIQDATLGDLWEALKIQGIAFDREKKRGAFPLVWLPGEQIIMYSGSREEIQSLVGTIEDLLRSYEAAFVMSENAMETV